MAASSHTGGCPWPWDILDAAFGCSGCNGVAGIAAAGLGSGTTFSGLGAAGGGGSTVWGLGAAA